MYYCRCICQFKGHVSPVTAILITGNDAIITSGRDKVIHMWAWPTGDIIKTLPVFEVCSMIQCWV